MVNKAKLTENGYTAEFEKELIDASNDLVKDEAGAIKIYKNTSDLRADLK